jgi:hypothetical protein
MADTRTNGLRVDEVTADDDVLRLVVTDYTREAGVRQLERNRDTPSKTATSSRQVTAGARANCPGGAMAARRFITRRRRPREFRVLRLVWQ